jgi:hypothetical protein
MKAKRGSPMRAVILKARQIGFSTLAQALTIWRTTLQENHSAIVVAHDLDTGAKLFKMGRTMYSHLPADDELPLKPPVSSFKRSRFMHFGSTAEAWQHGDVGIDSEYLVSTASEPESGRGGTYRTVHGSEVAMWPDIDGKVTSLLGGTRRIPTRSFSGSRRPRASTASRTSGTTPWRGSDFIPFFWPWWKHEEYSMAFMDEGERAEFRIGDTISRPTPSASRCWSIRARSTTRPASTSRSLSSS